jgi:lipoate-protein ligase B
LLYDLGFVRDYNTVWQFQKVLLEKRIAGEIPDSLVLVEHDHVLTLGRSTHFDNILVEGLPKFEIERGGDVTYHGPGQLVAYPIISLQERSLGVRQYVELLESIISGALDNYGIKSNGKLGQLTGVWVENKRKIASIGVAVSHWVTYHGFALNVNTDLTYFQKIKPCGFEYGIMTSVRKELGRENVDMSEVKKMILAALSERLQLEFEVKETTFQPSI